MESHQSPEEVSVEVGSWGEKTHGDRWVVMPDGKTVALLVLTERLGKVSPPYIVMDTETYKSLGFSPNILDMRHAHVPELRHVESPLMLLWSSKFSQDYADAFPAPVHSEATPLPQVVVL